MTTILRAGRRNHLDALVCAVATHDERGLRQLRESCEKFSIHLTVFGWGERYEGHGWKLLTQRSALRQLAGEYEHVVFVDAFDSLFVTGLDEVMGKFLAFDTSILMGTELNCWPPWGPAPEQYPPAPTRYRYLNSGGYVGRLSVVLEWLEQFESPDYANDCDDQAFWAKVFVAGEPRLKLDYGNQVFQSLYETEEDIELEPGGRVRNRATESRPCILHGNGGADMSVYYQSLLRDRR